MSEPRTSAGRDMRRHLFPKITPFVMRKVTEDILAIEIEAYELGCAATARALSHPAGVTLDPRPDVGPRDSESWISGWNAAVKAYRDGEITLDPRPAKPDPEAVTTLAADLFAANRGACRIVAEWMLERGWTEPLDDAPDARPAQVDGSLIAGGHQHDTDACDGCDAIYTMGREDAATLGRTP